MQSESMREIVSVEKDFYSPYTRPRTLSTNGISRSPEIVSKFDEQLKKIKTEEGFIAALDQSGGSTPKALEHYGISDDAWSTEKEMFDLVHQMRTRIFKSPAFDGARILGSILFENTMDREVDGKPTPGYLWDDKRVVPFLKVDKGLADLDKGVQLMKPIPGFDELLERSRSKGVFGTKMRSVIKEANPEGIAAIVEQQFGTARQIIAHGLIPIIEPEVDIKCPKKAEAEKLLKTGIVEQLNQLDADQLVMLKVTLPDQDNFYRDCIDHPRVLRVVALSGGYPRDEANVMLERNNDMVASFSRALLEGLSAQQSEEAFNATLDTSIQSIFEASKT